MAFWYPHVLYSSHICEKFLYNQQLVVLTYEIIYAVQLLTVRGKIIVEWVSYCGGLLSNSDHVTFGYSLVQGPFSQNNFTSSYFKFCILTLIRILMIESGRIFVHVTTCTKLWPDSMIIISSHRNTQGLDYELINCLWNSSQAITCHWEINWRASQNTGWN